MGEIKVEQRSVVAPGEVIAVGMDLLPGMGTYRKDEEILASRVGLAEVSGSVIKIIPLRGRYIPKRDDLVIGKVVDIGYSTWTIDIRAPDSAFLSVSDASTSYIDQNRVDISRFYDVGDFVFAKIVKVSKQMYVQLTMKEHGLRKLKDGMMIEISPVKVPRVIGKKGSMISMIKKELDCEMLVGQNGRVWILGKNRKDELKAVNVVRFIEDNAHVPGLTDTVKEMLEGFKNENKKDKSN